MGAQAEPPETEGAAAAQAERAEAERAETEAAPQGKKKIPAEDLRCSGGLRSPCCCLLYTSIAAFVVYQVGILL